MTPEQEARQTIDYHLADAGWQVQDHRSMNISAAAGVAVREFPLKTGEADYLLYADGRCIGVVEAKPEGHTPTGVELQSAKYTSGLPDRLPHWHLPRNSVENSQRKLAKYKEYLHYEFALYLCFANDSGLRSLGNSNTMHFSDELDLRRERPFDRKRARDFSSAWQRM